MQGTQKPISAVQAPPLGHLSLLTILITLIDEVALETQKPQSFPLEGYLCDLCQAF